MTTTPMVPTLKMVLNGFTRAREIGRKYNEKKNSTN